MKGLILKDLYLIVRIFKIYIAVIVIFSVISPFMSENSFLSVYPYLFAAMLPVSVLSYDERDKWCVYSQTLPISRKTYVSEKYVLGLIICGVLLVFGTLIHAVSVLLPEQFAAGPAEGLMDSVYTMFTASILVCTVFPAFLMPFVFKLGTEKGRIAFIFTAAVVAVVMTPLLVGGMDMDVPQIGKTALLMAICLISAAVYVLSWMLSVKFYEKRDI